jgi:hypothetical protein
MGKITTDLLGALPIEIFLITLEEFVPTSHDRRELISVVNLSSVCRNWRRIITNTPRFWIYVTINPSFNERHYSRARYPARLELQLHRTGTALLHIRWYLSGGVHPKLMEIVYKKAPLERWRSLSLCMNENASNINWRFGAFITHVPPDFPVLLGRFDNLETVSLYGVLILSTHFVELVEQTALRLRRLEVNQSRSPVLKAKFPKTFRFFEMYAAG